MRTSWIDKLTPGSFKTGSNHDNQPGRCENTDEHEERCDKRKDREHRACDPVGIF